MSARRRSAAAARAPVHPEPFPTRTDAGRRLAEALGHLRGTDPLVLALPRGGVPVALPIARSLDAPLEVLVVRKLGAPESPEFGLGAIAEGGTRVVNPQTGPRDAPDPGTIDSVEGREAEELRRRVARYRGGRPLPDLRGRVVVIVDDGIATGGTARAAARAVRGLGAARVVLAVPVAAHEALRGLRGEVDEVVCLLAPESLFAIGAWYEDFSQVSDAEVLRALGR